MYFGWYLPGSSWDVLELFLEFLADTNLHWYFLILVFASIIELTWGIYKERKE